VAFVFLATLTSLALLALGGAISEFTIALTLKLLPVLAVGVVGGFSVANRLSNRGFEIMVLGFLLVVGLLGLANALR